MTRFMGAIGAEISERGGEYLHGPDRSAAHHPPISSRPDAPELMTVMTSGMAHVSGGIMAAYIALASNQTPAKPVIMTALEQS